MCECICLKTKIRQTMTIKKIFRSAFISLNFGLALVANGRTSFHCGIRAAFNVNLARHTSASYNFVKIYASVSSHGGCWTCTTNTRPENVNCTCTSLNVALRFELHIWRKDISIVPCGIRLLTASRLCSPSTYILNAK